MNLITLTDNALDRVRVLIQGRTPTAKGIRISLKTKGCSGLSYAIAFVDTVDPLDDVIVKDDVTIYIDPKAILYLLGSEMDFVEEKLHSGFTFVNPNEKGRCGCGKSFHV